MASRIAAFVIWAAVAASAVYWALQLRNPPRDTPAHAVVVSAAGAFHGDPALVLGADEAPVAAPQAAPLQADPRFRLIGVVAPRVPGAAAATGVALIATDGKPPKAYRVGASVDGDLVLLAVHGRGASLGPRGQAAQVDLQLPPLPPPATGTLPPAVAVGALPRPVVPLPQTARPLPPPVPSMPPQAVPSTPQSVPQAMPLSGGEIDADTEAPPVPPPGGTRVPTVPLIPHNLTRPPA